MPAELRASAPPAGLLLPWPQNILFFPFSGHTSTGAAGERDTGMWLPTQPPGEQRLSAWAAARCRAPGPPHLKNPWKCPAFTPEHPHGCSRLTPAAPVAGVLPPVSTPGPSGGAPGCPPAATVLAAGWLQPGSPPWDGDPGILQWLVSINPQGNAPCSKRCSITSSAGTIHLGVFLPVSLSPRPAWQERSSAPKCQGRAACPGSKRGRSAEVTPQKRHFLSKVPLRTFVPASNTHRGDGLGAALSGSQELGRETEGLQILRMKGLNKREPLIIVVA